MVRYGETALECFWCAEAPTKRRQAGRASTAHNNSHKRRPSVLGRRRRGRRCRACVALTIPRRVLPAVDQTVVAAERAVPDDVSRRTVQFGDDFAAAPPTARTAPAGHIREPIAFWQVIGHPRHDGAEENGQTQRTFWDGLQQIPGVFVDVGPHVHNPAGWFHDASTRDGISANSRAIEAYSSVRCARETASMSPTISSNLGLAIFGTVLRFGTGVRHSD